MDTPPFAFPPGKDTMEGAKHTQHSSFICMTMYHARTLFVFEISPPPNLLF